MSTNDMFTKYEYQRKKSPFNKKSNEVSSVASLKADCNGSRKLNGSFNKDKNGGFSDARSSSTIRIDDSDSDEDVSDLLKSVFHDSSTDSFQSKSKKSNQDIKNSSSSVITQKTTIRNNEISVKVDEKVNGKENILKSLHEVFPNASKELIQYAAQEAKNVNEACNIVSDSMKVMSQNDKEESPVINTAKQKRKRVIPFDDSDSDACLTPIKKQRNSTGKGNQNDSSNVTNTNQDPPPEDENFRKLREMFLSRSDSDIQAALEMTNHLGEARIVLSNPFWSSRNRDFSAKNTKQMETIEISDNEDDANGGNSKDSAPDSESSAYDDDNHNIDSKDDTYLDSDMSSKQTRILSFLDDCSLEELAMIPGLSEKKASKLISLRPFESWTDLEAKLKSSKSLSNKFIEKAYHVLRKRDDVHNLMKRCEKISKDVQLLLSAQLNEQISQPATLNPSCQLKPYQLTGLHWLKLMHDKGMNCILADEMGLGKTVQALSFIAHLIEQGDNGPYLIVAPASTLDNWVRELKHFYPDVTYIPYYGSQEERSFLRDDIRSGDYQVIIATYQTAISTFQDRRLFQKKLKVHYVVFDEGHMLKNMQSQRYQKLFNINAKRRLLLTGTPLQNNLMELMSLLCFVMPNMFGTCEVSEGLNMLFSNKKGKENSSVRSYHEERLQQASRILKPFVLRRLKIDVLSQLPSKTEKIVMVELTDKQRALYEKVFTECRKEFKKQQSGGLYGKNRNLLMPLRMTSNHPLLLRNNFDDSMLHEMAIKYCRDISHRDSEVDLVYEDMTVMSDFELHRMCRGENNLKSYVLEQKRLLDSGKFEYLRKTLPEMKEKGDRVLLFSQFTLVMDVIEVFLKHHRYRFLRLDGATKVNERQDLIDQFNNDKDIFIFLLSTRAGGLGINLTSANVVILHDIDFNPYNDKQAEDRCHRVGQTREVHIYKLISKGTIEEAILNCAKSKLKLEQDVVSTQDNENSGFEESEDDVITVLGQTFKE